MRFFATLLLFVLAACSTASWDKPGATHESIQKDGEACWDEARGRSRAYTSSAPDGVVVGAPVDRARDRSMDESGAFQQCMRDKGYSEKK